MNEENANKKRRSILSTKRARVVVAVLLFVLILGAIFLALSLTIWKPTSDIEWFEVFNESLKETDVSFAAQQAEKSPVNITRRIKIEDGTQIVATFEQSLSLDCRNGQQTGYLKIDETYPTLGETSDDIHDEYYLNGGVMHMRRQADGEDLTTQFDSDMETLFTVATENISSVKYDLNEDYFTVAEGANLINKENGSVVLRAAVREEIYGSFFGEGTDVIGITSLTIEMWIDEGSHSFHRLILKYNKDGLHYTSETECNMIGDIGKPDWTMEEGL